MYPAAFEYRKANSVSEAISLIKQLGEDAKVLSGVHNLFPTMKIHLAQPGTLIDIGGLDELKNIMDNGDHLVVGAGVTHWMLESSEMVVSNFPALSQAAAMIGDVQIRNRQG